MVDSGVRHDTRCEKYCKQSDTTGGTVYVPILLEYRTLSVNQIQGPEITVV